MKRANGLLFLWSVLLYCVVAGSLLPATSPVMLAFARVPVSGKLLHFLAYAGLAVLPVMSFDNRREGVLMGLSTFLLGLLLEGGQNPPSGHVMELSDVLANGAGVTFGAIAGIPLRRLASIL